MKKIVLFFCLLVLPNIFSSNSKQFEPVGEKIKKESILSKITDLPEIENLIPEIQGSISEYLNQWVEVYSFYNGSDKKLWSIAYSSDSKYLATGDVNIRIWDVNNNYNLLYTLGNGFGRKLSLVYSPNNKHLASVGRNLQIWDANNNYKLLHNDPRFDKLGPRSLAYSADDKYLAVGGMQGDIIPILDANNNYSVYTKIRHDGWVNALSYSDDNKYLASGSNNNIYIWDINNKYKLLKTFENDTSSLIFSPNSRHLASNNRNNINIWNVNNNFNLLQTLSGHTEPVTSIAYSKDNKFLASASDDKTIKIWDANKDYKLLQTLIGHISPITAIAFASNNKFLASADASGIVKIWHYEGLE